MCKTGYFKSMLLVFCLGTGLFGCATTSKVSDLESETRQALEIAQEALKQAESAKAMIEEVSEYKAAAEKSALRAEKAAKDARDSANRAEKCEKRCEGIYEQIMSK
jgi:hypothetical protein